MLTLKMDPISFVALTSIIQTVCIAFRINGIASGNFILLNGIISNLNDRNQAKLIAFYKTHSGLGLIISLKMVHPQSQTVPF